MSALSVMQVNLPWTLSRKRLITAAILDLALFIALYYKLFHWRFEGWPGLSLCLGVLLALWMLSSYVVGRFTSGDSKLQFGPGLSLVRQITSTSLVLSVTLAITVLYLWIFNQNSADETFRSFLIPFLCLLAILSSTVQFLLNRFVSSRDSSVSQKWSYVGSEAVFKQLLHSLQWSRISVDLVQISPSDLINHSPNQIVFDDIATQDPDVLGHLLRLQKNGSAVISRLDWCETYLQRFPSVFLTEEDLLIGRFWMPSGTIQNRLKRSGDVLVAVILLIITSPLFLIACLLIKMTDRGPVFYSQTRTGLFGQPYKVWKLRTMRINAERDGAQWSTRSDPRITKVGLILRNTRLDELPQLICVLNGTMSLIGPRPERPEIDQQLKEVIPFYSIRYSIRPGLSGWAQVNYPYGASVEDSANKLSYDLYYLRNFSFWLDLLILFKTVRLVLNAQGARPDLP